MVYVLATRAESFHSWTKCNATFSVEIYVNNTLHVSEIQTDMYCA